MSGGKCVLFYFLDIKLGEHTGFSLLFSVAKTAPVDVEKKSKKIPKGNEFVSNPPKIEDIFGKRAYDGL